MFFQNNNVNANILGKSQEAAKTTYEVALSSINNLLNSIVERLPYILAGILVLIIFWILSKIIKRIFWTASSKTKLDNRLRILFGRLIAVVVTILGIFTALTVIIPSFGFGDLITGLGFTSFVIGFATKDILNNLLSGVLILWQQPFQIGDYIFVKSIEGNVEYIGVRATRLRKDDGELILIPNGEMYSNALTIRGAGAGRRMKLQISVGFDADVDETKQIIYGVLEKLEGVENEPKPNIVVTDLTTDGANLSIYFWVNTDTNSPLQIFDQVASGIKKALSKNNIELYPPPTVIMQNPNKQKTAETEEEEKSKNDL
ncbi:mechanosensitive ion channel family protein [soil metagenome]